MSVFFVRLNQKKKKIALVGFEPATPIIKKIILFAIFINRILQ